MAWGQPSPWALPVMIFRVLLLLRWNAFGSRSLGKITSKVGVMHIHPSPKFALCGPDRTQAQPGSDSWEAGGIISKFVQIK